MSLGAKIAELRKEKQMSQEELANALQLSRQAVSKWENDLANPDTENLIRLAEIFQIDVNVLIGSPLTVSDKEAPAESVVSRKYPSKTICLLTLLLALCLCSTTLFAGLWLYERNMHSTAPQIPSKWHDVKMSKGLKREEITLTESQQQQLAEYIFCFNFVEESTDEEAESSTEHALTGGRMYCVTYYMDDVYFYWFFTEQGSSCAITAADGTQTLYHYNLDWTLLYELDKYAYGR